MANAAGARLPKEKGQEVLTLSGFAAAAFAMAGLLVAVYWISEARSVAAGLVTHTHDVRTSIAGTRAALAEARAFPGEAPGAALARELAGLSAIIRDNASQQARVRQLEAGVARTDDAAYGEARAVLASMDAEELRLLAGREEILRRDIALFWVAAASIGIASIVALAVLYSLVRRRGTEQQAFLEAERRFHLFTQSISDYAMLMLDAVGRITSWNSGAERIKGYAASEIIGQHFSVFYPPEDAADGKPARELDIASEFGRYEEEGWRVRKDGSRFWAHVTITALRDDDRRVTGFGKVTRDLTERKRAEDSLLAEVSRRREAEVRLVDSNADLESRVEERTRQLLEVNADLLEAKERLQALSSRLITAQEEERRRIARELHDETGQALTSIRLRVKDAMRGRDDDGQLGECLAIIDQAVAHIRGLAVNLRPPMLDDLGLADALEWALDQQAKAAGWRVSIRAQELDERIASEIETACYRIGQEALTNAARHAQAKEVRVELRVADGTLELTVADDGEGFDERAFATSEERRKHFGLVSMRERATLAGGTLEVDSARGKGTRIRVRFPLGPASEAET